MMSLLLVSLALAGPREERFSPRSAPTSNKSTLTIVDMRGAPIEGLTVQIAGGRLSRFGYSSTDEGGQIDLSGINGHISLRVFDFFPMNPNIDDVKPGYIRRSLVVEFDATVGCQVILPLTRLTHPRILSTPDGAYRYRIPAQKEQGCPVWVVDERRSRTMISDPGVRVGRTQLRQLPL